MSRKRKKNSINWLFNKSEALMAVMPIGARNLTEVEAVVTTTTDTEEIINSYSKMVEHNSDEADQKLAQWILDQPKRFNGLYVYFRFKRLN